MVNRLVPIALSCLLAACVQPGATASQTVRNENQELRGIIRAQEGRIDELTRQRNALERKLGAAPLAADESDATGKAGKTGRAGEAAESGDATPDMTEHVARMLERFKSDSDIEVEPVPDGYRFVLREQVLFGKASAELTADGRSALQRIADTLRGRGSRIVIEGHTDNVKLVQDPTRPQYPRGNIELSLARGLAVWEYLVRDGRIDEARLAVVGYGPHRPRLPNDSERNRYRNRRVEIRVAESR